MILLFSSGGRTGNQLFQIAYAISQRRRGELFLTFGFSGTKSVLSDGPWKRGWLNVDTHGLGKVLGAAVYSAVHQGLVRTGLASYHTDKGSVPIIRKGILRRLTVIKGYFESPALHRKDLGRFFRLNETLVERVRPALAGLPPGRVPVFVHLRRGDLVALARTYADGFKLLLPDEYYQEAVDLFLRRHPASFFLIVGDDPAHAEVIFRDLDAKVISRRSVGEDLALMSLCHGGVLSNSTFSWWGAFFGTRELGFVVPKGWPRTARPAWEPGGALPAFTEPT
jgi:hypothetical protein